MSVLRIGEGSLIYPPPAANLWGHQHPWEGRKTWTVFLRPRTFCTLLLLVSNENVISFFSTVLYPFFRSFSEIRVTRQKGENLLKNQREGISLISPKYLALKFLKRPKLLNVELKCTLKCTTFGEWNTSFESYPKCERSPKSGLSIE